MSILLIEICNFTDFPTGGHLSFVKNMQKAFGDQLNLVGCSTDGTKPGMWLRKEVNGTEYNYLSVFSCSKSGSRPWIPARLRGFLALRYYRKEILNCQYDIIFIQTPEVLFSLPASVLDKCIIRMPGVENPLAKSRYWYGKYLASFFDLLFFRRLKQCRMILATADKKAIEEFVQRSDGALNKNSIVQYPTRYDNAIFHPTANRRDDKQKTSILTVGRLGWFKGWKFMIDCFVLFLNDHPDSIFYFIGDGEDETKIRQYIETKGLGEQILLLGKQAPEAIADYLNKCDLFIMGSYFEGWSTTLVEACACGIPCVVTDFSSSEMITDGYNGYVIKERDEKLFARKMADALTIRRDDVKQYNQKFDALSVQNMKQTLFELINNSKLT